MWHERRARVWRDRWPAVPMPLSARTLNRATLARQLLLQREAMEPVEGVRRVVALQAQEPVSPYVALWNRIVGFDAADLDAAYIDHSVVKATLMRITLHVVAASDYPPFQHAVVHLLRASRLSDRRFAESGLTFEDADALVPEVLAFAAEPRTNAEMQAWLEQQLGRPVPRAWWALRTFAPVVHAPAGARWTHGPKPKYVAARVMPPTGDAAASVQHLLRRYLEGFGPATARDIAQFTFLRKPTVTAALDAMAGELRTLEGVAGEPLYDVPDGSLPDEETPAPPRLMAMWDSCLLAYADRSRIVPADYRSTVFRRNGDVLPCVLINGYVAGVWRPHDGGIEVASFRTLPNEAWEGLAAEAHELAAFLSERDPAIYRRHMHWWGSISSCEVRVLRG